MIKNITLEISIWGSVFDAQVYLEGNKIGLWQTNTAKKIKFRKLPGFQIAGNTLDVEVRTLGKDGSSVTLTVKFDTTVIDTVTCTNTDGTGLVKKSIAVHENLIV